MHLKCLFLFFSGVKTHATFPVVVEISDTLESVDFCEDAQV